MSESQADALRAFVSVGTTSIDAEAVVSTFFGADGTVGGIGVGMTCEELRALGFEVPDTNDFREYAIDAHSLETRAKHRFEYAVEDGVVCRAEYALYGTDEIVELVAQAFLDAVESELGEATSHLGTERWMVGDDAQFVLEWSRSRAVEVEEVSEEVLASVSFMIWDGDGEEFPGSFDAKPLETAIRAYVSSEFGGKIALGNVKIWKESPYVYFNLVIESPEDELDFDWDGNPMDDGSLSPSFRALLNEELGGVLDL